MILSVINQESVPPQPTSKKGTAANHARIVWQLKEWNRKMTAAIQNRDWAGVSALDDQYYQIIQ